VFYVISAVLLWLVLCVGCVGCYVNCGYVLMICSKIRVRKFLILVGW